MLIWESEYAGHRAVRLDDFGNADRLRRRWIIFKPGHRSNTAIG